MGYISPPQPASHQVTREIYLRDCSPPGRQCGLALPSPLPFPSPSPHRPSTPGAQDSSFPILWRNNYRPQPYRSSVPGNSSSQPSACHRHSGCPPDLFIGLPKPEMVGTSKCRPLFLLLWLSLFFRMAPRRWWHWYCLAESLHCCGKAPEAAQAALRRRTPR